MQPNDPFQQPSGIDYLNQISAPAAPTGFDKKSKIIMITAGIVGLLSLVAIMLTTLGQSNSGPSPVNLSAQLQVLTKLSTKYGPQLRTSGLQDANSSLGALLTTTNQAMNRSIADYGIDPKKTAGNIAILSDTTKIEAVLDDAYLNATLDDAYKREMLFQLESTLVMMRRIERSTGVQSMKELLSSSITDFENIKKQIENASN